MNYKQWIFGRQPTKHDIKFRKTIAILQSLIKDKSYTVAKKIVKEYKEHSNIANPYLREAKDRIIEVLDKDKDFEKSIKEAKKKAKKI